MSRASLNPLQRSDLQGQDSFSTSRYIEREPRPGCARDVAIMDRRVKSVIDYMSTDLRRPLDLEKVAHSVNLSASRMQHLFKADTNMTAAQYLKFLRLQMAKKLIESTFLSTKEIMQKVGIRDESHFVKDFRKTYGLPPASYKRRLPTLRADRSVNR
jgi:transcriptional regulator GlxA family with amidase domain